MTVALREVAALVYRESGIRIGEHQHRSLQAALDRMGADHEPAAFLRRVSDPLLRATAVARLIEEVTIKETFFLRDRGQLESIDWRLLADAARARGAERVRVWTAACATGEEAYGLALLASEAFAPAPAPVSILATDISEGALARARQGAYGARSVSGLDAGMRRRWFRDDGAGLVVGEQLRALVTFARHNLIRDPFPPLGEARFDLVLCRNVLIYFDAETVGGVLASFERARSPSGSLVLGAADVLCASAAGLALASAPVAVARSAQVRPKLRAPLGRAPVEARAGADAVLAEAADYFRRGLAELEAGDPRGAVRSLRSALFVDPQLGLAAFKLGGAHEVLGELAAARRAYEQALRALEPDERHEPHLAQIDLADVAAAAQARLDVLAGSSGKARPGRG
jgi:chemotaxis protein methyltransferase CheR